MTTVEADMKHTIEFIICSVCKQSNQFEYFVVHQDSQYYLGTKCPRERCHHVEEFKAVPYRIASEYLETKLS